VSRLLDYYQRTAAHADRWLARVTRPAAAHTGGAGEVLTRKVGDQRRAQAWMRAERDNLLACLDYTADRDPARMVALTGVLAGLLHRDGPWPQATHLHHRACTTAHRLGDRLGEANALTDLGGVRWLTGDYGPAADLAQQALDIYRDIGDRRGEAEALNGIGMVLLATSQPGDALVMFTDALGLARAIGNHLEQGRALDGTARCHASVDDTASAMTDLHAAFEIYRRLGAPEAAPAAAYLAELESRQLPH
jgi:tetratricopeptide (TPR) repeat protein